MILERLLRDAWMQQGTSGSLCHFMGLGSGVTVPVWVAHEPELWLQVHRWMDVRTNVKTARLGLS